MDVEVLTEDRLGQAAEHGVAIEEIRRQLGLYMDPPGFARLVRACTPGDGIAVLDSAEADRLAALFDEARGSREVVKFVPASGAASRMFKAPSSVFFGDDPVTLADLEAKAAQGDGDAAEVQKLIENLKNFAFDRDLQAAIREDGRDPDELLGGDVREVLGYLLSAKGLAYASLPKGLLKFHAYDERSRTAFEEHLVEAAEYARDQDGVCRLHFTVSPEHESLFRALADDVVPGYEADFGVTFEIDFSTQKTATDAIAVDLENKPFIDNDGGLFFRPAGHGALIANLDEIDADVVFVKNIDNVVPDHLKGPTLQWKKVIGGVLVETQNAVFEHVRKVREADASEADVEAALDFWSTTFGGNVPEAVALGDPESRRCFALEKLDRPTRVCGMVRNTGEPGGGPFWIRSEDGEISAQVVEAGQVDPGDAGQQDIMKGATHFNPVDLVCAIRDCDGKPYDLDRYVDENAVFIVEKSKDGRPLKSLERPGLWNGGMAFWNTLFVDVPLETFSPVKTVTALLGETHQPA